MVELVIEDLQSLKTTHFYLFVFGFGNLLFSSRGSTLKFSVLNLEMSHLNLQKNPIRWDFFDFQIMLQNGHNFTLSEYLMKI